MPSLERRRRPNLRTDVFRPKTGFLGFDITKWAWRPTLRLAVTLVTIFTLAAVIELGGPPFRFRLGQRAEFDIRLRVPVHIPNQTKTRIEQEQKAAKTLAVFAHRPEPFRELLQRLKELAKQIAATPKGSYDDLDIVTRSEWKLTREAFHILAERLRESPEILKRFSVDLETALQPLLRRGLLEDSDIQLIQQRQNRRIDIRLDESEDIDELDVAVEDVSRDRYVDNPPRTGMLHTKLQEQFGEKVAGVLYQLILPYLTPTLEFDADATRRAENRARQSVDLVVENFSKGSLVVQQDEIIDEEQLALLEQEHKTLVAEQPWHRNALRFIGLIGVVTGLILSLSRYLAIFEAKIFNDLRQVTILAAVSIVALAATRLLGWQTNGLDLLPITMAGQILTLTYHRRLALTWTISLSLLAAVMQPHPLDYAIVLIAGSFVGILSLDSVNSRTKLHLVGLATGLTFGGFTLALGCFHNQPLNLLLTDAGLYCFTGFLASLLIGAFLPFLESALGVVTGLSLIELEENHPLLRELAQRAPGTYQHSKAVSFLAEAAAKRIGADALLVRVAALFHDIGKMNKPHYFIENRLLGQPNLHERLAPAMSKLIIIGHVKDGMELGREHRLPQRILDFIEQHHGTTLVDFFFYEATREARASEGDEEVEESEFRYPGPKPQTKETAILMLSDCVESASRTLREPTHAQLEKLAQKLTLNRLLDGQFDESGLTLQEIKEVEASLVQSLAAVYHSRVKYPAAQ